MVQLFLGCIPLVAVPQEKPQDVPKRRTIRIAFAGDVLMEAPWRQTPPPGELFEGVKEQLSSADITVVNLESPLSDWPEKTRYKNPRAVAAGKDYILRTVSPEAATALRDAGVDVAALANNHTVDAGERGLLDTIARLQEAAVIPSGAGENRAAAEQAAIVTIDEVRVAFLSFSDVVPPGFAATEKKPGIASAKDIFAVRDAVRAARAAADVLVVVFHWGKELERWPTLRQRQLARAVVDEGASVVFGAHPHVLQGVGCERRVPVVFSAGNFIFPASRPLAQRSSIFEVEFVEVEGEEAGKKWRAEKMKIVPTMMNEEGRARLADDHQAREILRDISRFSSGLGARFQGDVAVCSSAQEKTPTVPKKVQQPRNPA